MFWAYLDAVTVTCTVVPLAAAVLGVVIVNGGKGFARTLGSIARARDVRLRLYKLHIFY